MPPKRTAPSISVTDGRVLGLARLEQLGHARQTAGDVAGLGDVAADPGQIASPADHLLAVLDLEDGPGGQRVVGEALPGRAEDVDVRLEHLLLVVDDDLGAAGRSFSSTSSRTVTRSLMSPKRTVPFRSVMMGVL